MNSKGFIFAGFLLVVVAQLLVPAKMIYDKEKILEEGMAFKFQTAPIDPTDPLRGKYISLSYKDNFIDVDSSQSWTRGDEVYVLFEEVNGYAVISDIYNNPPSSRYLEDDMYFLKTTVNYISKKSADERHNQRIYIDYPFDRFYMGEFKALDAEKVYWDANRSVKDLTYALVNIKQGEAVLKDVYINEVPIKEVVEAIQREREANLDKE